MSFEDGNPLFSRGTPLASDSLSTQPPLNRPACTSEPRQAARPRSLLGLDDDLFNYICSYVPVSDLLRSLAAACWEVRRRVSASHTLWQQLWMRYLLFFCNSLIPAAAPAASSALSSAPSTPELWAAAFSDMMGMLHTTTSSPHNRDSVWHLYYFHHSAEEKPHVVHLEKLHLVREVITDPAAAAAPTLQRAPSELRTAETRAQLLSFAQACGTQTVTDNLTHLTAPPSPSSSSSSPLNDPRERVPWSGAIAQRSSRRVRKQQQQQADRLQRVLHFLLSTTGHRPRFHDRLWGATKEAEREFIRKTQTEAGSTAAKQSKRRNPQSPPLSHRVAVSPPPPARPRPMSWLDDQETSVKVLLFDDDTRSVGDAAAVQEARSKLLASIAKNWRTAYASHFYLSTTDGNDPGNPLPPAPASPSLDPATETGAAGERSAPPVPGVERSRQHRQSLGRGQATWEQVYRRFRDGNSASIRSTARTQQRAAARRREVGIDEDNDDAVVPSSSNPLFDLHLLGYEKRKQVYAAMLASTVEVPDGMGAFFGTCVSESFLRWWCWRNRRRAEARQAPVALSTGAVGDDDRRGLPMRRRHIALAPFTATPDDAWLPRSLWVVQVASRGPQDDIGGNEVEGESVAYSSSYSDVTTTTSNASSNMPASSSISFSEEREEESHFGAAEGTGVLEAVHAVTANGAPQFTASQTPSQQAPPPLLLHDPPVALLFPLPHMLTYWFMMHHVSFYSHQVYRRMWGDQELTIAVWSRIISPTGHSVECRLFYSLRCATFPRMFMKMMFTPGMLPLLTLQDKMAERSPYCSSSSSSSHSHSSPANSNANDGGGATSRSSSASTDHQPVDSRQIYDLFWTGFGRVEVDSGPTISRPNMVRLRVALGLPADFPMGLLWNVVMFASGIGPLVLKDHRHSMHFNYDKTFTDVVADEFGDLACFGYGARWPSKRDNATAMVNPLDTDVALRERHTAAAVSPAVGQRPLMRATDDSDQGTFEGREAASSALDGAHYGTPTTSASLTDVANWSWNLDSEFSSVEGYWSQPGSDVFSPGSP
ncbi:hypothetical protein LSCM1_06908 [Leishmania martiniquensis]|uniref:F-box domain-containing protein n=1 Tax=Leishmania martiniquensis TaxID=1580590 RepID=A0A836H159_9TRYP|nr:hypothetical protein LSCM1_06908 [Leishmania martiniquensis]